MRIAKDCGKKYRVIIMITQSITKNANNTKNQQTNDLDQHTYFITNFKY